MKATKFPREWIAYDIEAKEFLTHKQIEDRGVTLTADGLPYFNRLPFEFILLWRTGLMDSDGNNLIEDDIVEMYIKNEFGSLVKALAIMMWNPSRGAFMLRTGATRNGEFLEIENVVKVGHVITHPELAIQAMKPLWKNENEEK